MSVVSAKDMNMLLIAIVVVLYAVAALNYKKQAQNWKTAERVYANAQKRLQEEKALIAATQEWVSEYAQMRDLMPIFPYDKKVDTHWLSIMDATAKRNKLTLSRQQASKELEVGDVYELPIDCKDWEGSLESLVGFLHNLHKEGAMLDVRQLFIRPSNKPGILRGTFTLYCAYMRGDVADEVEEKKQKVEEQKAESGEKLTAENLENAEKKGAAEKEKVLSPN